jgi:hypothetical protein
VKTTTQQTAITPIKRLAITKDAKRVYQALADAGDWTPMTAMETALGKNGLRRVVEAVSLLIEERLVGSGKREGDDVFVLRALPVEAWERDENFMAGIAVRWAV